MPIAHQVPGRVARMRPGLFLYMEKCEAVLMNEVMAKDRKLVELPN